MKRKYKTGSANIIFADYPDPDVIRVNDTYYMISTTMHMMPGAVILRSYNLLDWEFCSYVYDDLDLTPGQKLCDNKGVYGKGMWAACLRYHNNLFYVSFVCNDTGKTYLYTSKKIYGPWKKQIIPGFFHDMSILFDDDSRTWVVSGNSEIHLTEFEKDLSAPKKDSDKIILKDDKENVWLGYEGSHIYKINGKYYLFLIHIPKEKMRTEACFVSDKIEGPYKGGDILCADLGGWNSGCAQGGIVQTNDGKYFGIVFQDHGALGRIPVLVPVTFDENDFPVFGERSTDGSVNIPKDVTVLDNRPNYKYKPLWSNNFTNPAWQWNHSHNKSLVKVTKKSFKVKTDKTVLNVTQASNTLTYRTFGEKCSASVYVDANKLNNSDVTGLCALEGVWGLIGISKENDQYFLISQERKEKNPKMNTYDLEKPVLKKKLPLDCTKIELKLCFDLSYPNQSVKLMYKKTDKQSFSLLDSLELKYTLDQFMGVRIGLFCYSTKEAGGIGKFENFKFDSNIFPIK